MTTKVHVDAHAGWPVKVEIIDVFDGTVSRSEEIVPPNSVRDFYITNTRSLTISEMSRPPANPETL